MPRTLEEGQWQCPDCEWYSPEPKGKERDNSERVHRAQLCPRYKRARWSHNCKGLLLEIRPGFVVVPYDQVKGGWYSVVAKATAPEDLKSYPRGGYNILVSDKDVETATSLDF